MTPSQTTAPQENRASVLDEIRNALADREPRQLSAAEVSVLSRKLKRAELAPDLRVAYLGNQTVGYLPDSVAVHCAADAIVVAAHLGGHGQYVQELLDPASELLRFRPHLIILMLTMRDLAPRIFYDFASLSDRERRVEFDRILDHLRSWVRNAVRLTDATVLVANFVVPDRPLGGIADLRDRYGELEFYGRLNLELMTWLRDEPRAYLFDLDRAAARFGKERALSPRLYYLARIEWQDQFLPVLADELRRYVKALLVRTKKCLVLDLDNTLWGGILGEDGPADLKLGPGSAQGEAYLAFQYAVLALKRRGILLAISSKNNFDEVQQFFGTNPNLVLKLSDFSAIEVNWEPKPQSLDKIARDLNIGVDSLVFLDDSPAECALVRAMLPTVTVVQLPSNPEDFADLLKRLTDFERLEATAQDARKAQEYQENRQRAALLQSIGKLDDYLRGLETTVTVRVPTASDATRIHQLINKTNQFNLTTQRHTPGEVANFLDWDKFDLRVVDAEDRFGKLGSIGLFMVDLNGQDPFISQFLLSCRAIGRQIEAAMLNIIKERYLASGRYERIAALYRPTGKNKSVENLYDQHGFSIDSIGPGGEKRYSLTASQTRTDAALPLTLVVED